MAVEYLRIPGIAGDHDVQVITAALGALPGVLRMRRNPSTFERAVSKIVVSSSRNMYACRSAGL